MKGNQHSLGVELRLLISFPMIITILLSNQWRKWNRCREVSSNIVWDHFALMAFNKIQWRTHFFAFKGNKSRLQPRSGNFCDDTDASLYWKTSAMSREKIRCMGNSQFVFLFTHIQGEGKREREWERLNSCLFQRYKREMKFELRIWTQAVDSIVYGLNHHATIVSSIYFGK